MTDVDLSAQIAAYDKLLPELRRDHRMEWVVIADEALQGAFAAFGDAIRFRKSRFADRPVLIRQVDAPPAYFPFLVIEA